MSLLKYIMSPFVDFKEGDPEPPKTTNPQTANKKTGDMPDIPYQHTTNINTRSNMASSAPATGSTRSSSLGEYQQHFEALIEEANAKNAMFQGTDFKEFIDSKIDVEAISDEATRYRTAFNVLKRVGLTKERLVTTGQEYINIIDSDLKGFEGAYTQKYKTDVEQKEQLLENKAAELQSLNEKIAVLNQELKQMSQDIMQSKEQLNSNKIAFIQAGMNKKKEIQNELQKIDQYF